MHTEIAQVLDFWFAGYPHSRLPQSEQIQRWFKVDPAFDESLRSHLGALYTQACEGQLADWAQTPEGALALVILLDQGSRNLWRGSGQAFAWDSVACQLAQTLCDRGWDHDLPPLARLFVYLPFEHSENLADQQKAVEKCQALHDQAPPELKDATAGFLDYAEKHLAVIARFGRFPHRNERLNRISTPEELAFLSEPGSAFG